MAGLEFVDVQDLQPWQMLTIDEASIALATVVEYYDERRLVGFFSIKIDRLAHALKVPYPLSLYGRFISMLAHAQGVALHEGYAAIDQQTARRLYKIADYCSRRMPDLSSADEEMFLTRQDCLDVKYKYYDAV